LLRIVRHLVTVERGSAAFPAQAVPIFAMIERMIGAVSGHLGLSVRRYYFVALLHS
jgi:hypothetical protein